jgi:hypothetical protein
MRKIIATLGLSIIAGFFSPLTAHALTSGCYTYTVSGSNATITDANSCTGVITVPSTLDGKTVVAIGSHAFGQSSAATSITLPDTVTTLNTYSFYQLPSLTYLNLGNGVATLDSYNVYGCPQLSTLILGSGFRILGKYATTGDSSLTTLNLPSGTTTINTYAFGNNSSVTTVTIPASVVNVQTYAFRNSSLTNITYAGNSADVISQLNSTFGNCGWSAPGASLSCPVAPAFTISSNSETATVGTPITGYSISSTGGTISSYSISPDISVTPNNGLSFNTSTGLITGTPTAAASAVTYTITGTNTSGSATATYSVAAITPPAISISHGKIAMSISQSTLSGGASVIGEVTLDAPIICANQSGSCEVTISMTSNNPTRLSISPQSLTWSATTWARPQFFTINSSLTGMTAASEIVTVSTTSAISQSQYYLGFAIPRILFTVNNPNWVAPVPDPVPDPVQQSKISGITPTTGVAGTPVTVTASGNFVEKISAIQIDGIGIAVGSWTQTPTSVTFTIPNKSAGSYSVQIYNGSAPVLAAQRFTVTAVPIPASLNPAPKQKKIYISCAKPGHGTRIAYGVNPVCPAGFVKR